LQFNNLLQLFIFIRFFRTHLHFFRWLMILFDIFAKEIVIIMEKKIKQRYEVPEAIILLIEPELLIALSAAEGSGLTAPQVLEGDEYFHIDG
jgi:hypothetical protein